MSDNLVEDSYTLCIYIKRHMKSQVKENQRITKTFLLLTLWKTLLRKYSNNHALKSRQFLTEIQNIQFHISS